MKGEGELELCLPSPFIWERGWGEGKDLSLHWDAPQYAWVKGYWQKFWVFET
jgi:hypothetical protein